MDSALDAKLSSVLGGRTAAALSKALGLSTVADLLGHYPRRYARRGELTALSELAVDENVTIVAEVVSVSERKMRAKHGSILEARISDGSGILTLTFFNQTWRMNELRPGVRGIFAGKIGQYNRVQQLAHPNYELFPPDAELDEEAGLKFAQQPIPLYPATSAVTSWQLHKSIGVVLDTLGELPDPIPDDVRAERGLLHYRRALELIHRPQKDSDWGAARKALRFREAFLLQAALLQQRSLLRAQPAEPRLPKPGGFLERFDGQLPFTLTHDQETVGAELASDLASAVPMNRLLQGEVGSGKTLVAL
ncbi:MAG TPA: ATP-dependent DNA helicase RecG, partial [Terrimesophilobacter sp.]|nr:ATP-dependent DNA helicase RecG [Terrimesophilobacter sp.]